MGIVSQKEHDALQEAISTKSALATAMLEDESVRLASQTRSKEYLDKLDEQDNRIPFWMWCTLWFILGVFFDMTIVNLSQYLGRIMH